MVLPIYCGLVFAARGENQPAELRSPIVLAISAEGQSRARRYCGACAAMLFYLWLHPHILALLLLLCIWIAQAMCAPALIGERFECGTFTARVS